jgi:hypothetical protein
MDEDKMDYIEVGPIRIPDINGPGIGSDNKNWGDNGHTLELQVSARPFEHFRVFINTGYRQIFHTDNKRFVNREPIWRVNAGADLGSDAGWTASIRAFYTSSYWSEVRVGGDVFGERFGEMLPEYLLLNARFSWKLAAEPFQTTAGVEAFNLLDTSFRDVKGMIQRNGPDYASERFGRRIMLFLEGKL